jgi:acetylglutamate kinase
MKPSTVIKVGGNDLSTPGFVEQLSVAIYDLNQTEPCILVHGGGRAITDLMARLGVKVVYVDGQRTTDEATLEAAEMILSGRVNKDLVAALLAAGVDALGLSGVDRGLLRVRPWGEDMGLVGRIVAVRVEVLDELCGSGVVPVVSPISLGPAGRYNVNADHAAGAIAGAVDASQAVFVTNTPGVKVDGEVVPMLSAGETRDLIKRGEIHGGMIPKVEAALSALESGVRQARITDLPGLHAGTGTSLVSER